MVMAIIGILAGCGSYLMFNLIRNAVFIPNKLNTDMLAQDALDIMIEGDAQAKGLRFSRSVASIQPYNLTFNNQENQTIRYRLDTVTVKLYRSINNNPDRLIPYYLRTGINITGLNNTLFRYYDAAEIETLNPNNVRRIKINLVAKTGTGSYADWQGQSEQLSSIALKKYQ